MISPSEIRSLVQDLERFLRLAILLVSPAALVGAGIHYSLLFHRVDIFPSSILTIKDHFDKAVDLLLPVFLYSVITLIGSLMFADAIGVGESREKKIHAWRLRFYDTALLATAILVYYFLRKGDAWLGLLIIMIAMIRIYLDVISWLFGKYFHSESKKIVRILFFLYMLFFLMLSVMVRNVDDHLIKASERFYANESDVIIDRLDVGFLMIRDGRYILSRDGNELIVGKTVADKDASRACEAGLEWACFNSISLTDGVE